ncbi:hypothetical protein HYPSUDRAFT_210002 [Hypholoma sublateritium FD-334 SS-4]|uniref:Uncharacterized protein n=1 Tax=Hypholoma sublateritium (strain FD-334 SS-4) TaxID=945553 RepID=A0A0D2NWI1_HYPSF|nr:hypothetical protein HYPSUDRAFT_210002 [Hypholoma sublateritium FD-334 SS-4]
MNKILPLVDREHADLDTLVYPVSTRARPLAMEEEEATDDDEEGSDIGEAAISVASNDSDHVALNPPTVGSSGSSKVPYVPYGIVFLREIRMGTGVVVPLFRDHRVPMVSDKTLQFIFGRGPEAIADMLFKNQYIITRNPFRTANKTRRTATRIPQELEPSKIFDAASRGVVLRPRPRDEGSDLESDSSDQNTFSEVDIDTRLTTLWHQFLADISAKAPNRRAATESSYCVLTPEQRDNVTDETYRNLRLREYFNDCQYKQATKEEWTAAFDKFWPAEPFVLKTSQNYGSMAYYKSWGDLVSQLTNMDAQVTQTLASIRTELRTRFRQLYWIPNIQADRVWYTKADPKHFKRMCEGDGGKAAAPRVLIRWDKQPII